MSKKRTETRKQKVIHLTYGKDDDLIEWLNTIPKGQQEATLKAALRAYKGRSQSDPVMRLEQSVSRLFSDLPGLIRSELSKVAVVAAPTAQRIQPEPVLNSDELAERSQKMKKATW